MRLTKHFEQIYRKEMLKKGKLIKALRADCTGFSLHHDEKRIEISIGYREQYTLTDLPYPYEYYVECHREHKGYHVKHPSTQKKVKKPMYTVTVYNHTHEMEVVSKHKGTYEYLLAQYNACYFIPDSKVSFDDAFICLNQGFSGIGSSEEMVTFANIIEYERQKDSVTYDARSW